LALVAVIVDVGRFVLNVFVDIKVLGDANFA
jgi:hypothetical protein